MTFSCSPIIFTFDSKPLYEGTLVLATLVQKTETVNNSVNNSCQEAQTSISSRKDSSADDLPRIGETPSRNKDLSSISDYIKGEVTFPCFLLNVFSSCHLSTSYLLLPKFRKQFVKCSGRSSEWYVFLFTNMLACGLFGPIQYVYICLPLVISTHM